MGDGWVLVIQRTALHDTPANLQTLNYYTTQTATGNFDDILQQVVDSLKDEGFGVLCDIDVSATFAEKLDIQDYRRYRIFGACKSAMTHQGLDVEIDLGVFLPCNMVIYETDAGEVVVSALKPRVMVSAVENEDLDFLARDVSDSFDRVFERLGSADADAET